LVSFKNSTYICLPIPAHTHKKKNRSRGKEGELNVERKVKLFQEKKQNKTKKQKKTTHAHTQTIQSKSRGPIVQNLLLRIKHFLTDSQCPLPPPEASRPPWGKIQNESEAILSLKAEQTHKEHISRTIRRVVICRAPALSPACNLPSILGSAALLVWGQQYNGQTKEEKSMVPTIRSNIDFTITGTNCSNR